MSAKGAVFLRETLHVDALDKDGKKFDRVSRISGRTKDSDLDVSIDVNTEIYPVKPGDDYSLALAHSLVAAGSSSGSSYASDPSQAWRDVGKGDRKTLADDYDYVMGGRVFKFEDAGKDRVSLLISYGGLLMSIEGPPRYFSGVSKGQTVYLMMRKA
ncbi:RNA polymerase [Gonapodya prolifera JEL478]|uniref:DNA-directed RNA polymerases I, II, and III subunit RPABC3 n=1 Tax=Gonapodya prolifera (strain JEL478) TaxID=1344416 RepID=A0A139A5J2_GONPJ|nr:RNA polymerase [Gonapodya prolifera JEL478]|eukprot:KXS12092.1 RNA polymerase [Gonapodya prolifera JEL478]